VVIRPLVYAGEDEARAYTKECELVNVNGLWAGQQR
jgi:hypothetical protein